MTITFKNRGTAATGTTSVSVSPNATTPVAADRSIMFVGTKPHTATIGTPTDWVHIGTATGGDPGSSQGIDTGRSKIAAFVRDGAFSGAQTVSITSGNASWAIILTFEKSLTNWSALAFTSGDDVTGGGTFFSATCSSDPGWTAGDAMVGGCCIASDATTIANDGSISTAIDATGISGGTVTGVVAKTASGQDIGGSVGWKTGSSGTATSAPTFDAVFTGSANTYGPALVVRLRDDDGGGITVRSVGTGSAAGGNVTVTKPTGTAEGDYLIAYNTMDPDSAASTMTGASGFSQIGTTNTVTSAGHAKVWAKVAGASEPADYTFGGAAGSSSAVVMLCLTGQHASTPIDVSPTHGGSSTAATAHVAPSIDPTVTDTLMITGYMALAQNGSGSYSPPSGMTERADVTAGAWTQTSVATQLLSADTATGTRTATFSESKAWIATSLAIAPSAGGPATVTLVPGTVATSAPAMVVTPSVTVVPGTVSSAAVAMLPAPVVALATGSVASSAVPVLPAPVVALVPGAISASATPPTVTPTVSLAPGVVATSATQLTVTPTVSLTPGVVVASAVPVSLLAPSEVTLVPGTVSITAAPLPITPVIQLTPGVVSVTAAPLPVAPGPVILVPGSVQLSAVQLGISVTVTLVPGVIALVSAPLTPTVGPVQLVPGSVQVLGVPPGITGVGALVLSPGTIALSVAPLTLIPGPVTVALVPGSVSITAAPLPVSLGPVILIPGSVQTSGVALGVVPGPVDVELAPGAVSMVAVVLIPGIGTGQPYTAIVTLSSTRVTAELSPTIDRVEMVTP